MMPSITNSQTDSSAIDTVRVPLGSLLLSFLKIGSIGFGGGMAVIALMEKEFVRTRRVISLEEFVHGVGLGQLLGAFAVNVSVFIGYRLFGITGALLSAGTFLLPSVALVILLSDLYFRYHAIPALRGTVDGLGPVVIALIINAAWAVGRKELRSVPAIVIGVAAFVAGVSGVNTVWILLAAGAAGFLLPLQSPPHPSQSSPPRETAERGSTPLLYMALPATQPLLTIAGTFLKVGMMFVGGGFVLVPVLHQLLVTQLHWLNPQQFLDGLAISNLTPGPVAVLATFAGYHMEGTAGALVATLALFSPGVLLMVVISHQYYRFRDNVYVHRFLSGINPAVAGLILSSAPLLGRTALTSWRGYALLTLSLGLLGRLRWPPVAVIAIGAFTGYFGLVP